MPTATTFGGWAVVFAVAGGYYWVTKQRKQKTLRKQTTKAEPRKDTKAKKNKKDGALSGGDDGKPTQKKKAQPIKPAQEEPLASAPVSAKKEGSEKDEDRKFAQQMANAKRGVVDAPKSQNSARTKSVKQTKAQEKAATELPSDNGTSTAGGDADDDESPIGSPVMPAANAPAVNGDVSDMLEKSAAGPSVLKITAPTKPAQPKKAKAPSAEVKETKKQRQNRQKAEEKKLALAEEEKIRKIQLESHRRVVREAEGRAAKDGSAFMASQAPSSSAWTAAPAVQATNGMPSKVENLDTYDAPRGHVTAKPVEEIYSESELAGSKLADELSKIPEEEQIRVATEDSGLWEQVKTSKKKKSKAAVNGEQNETKAVKQDTASSSNDDFGDYGVPAVIQPTGPGQKWSQNVTYVEKGKVHEHEEEIQDSEWEVA
ncbi:hypothetical protein LZ554_005209 [Drepanopeziza brunnea f. sp. 'monogermtubi']|nr:hypothetical protein LZ554_005209 [Drepanopeziza brunnea f. sp. 'monogermtubi']